MFLIRKKDFTVEGTKFIAEASTVGIRPGELWPQFVGVIGDERILFGPDFRTIETPTGEFAGRIYTDVCLRGLELHILND